VLDVSDGGLCILSPVTFKPKQSVLIQIDVPLHGPTEIEAVVWHMRKVKSGRAGVKVWSIGMMITKAGEGFEALLPDGSVGGDSDPSAELHAKLAELPRKESPTLSDSALDELEEDSLSAAELNDVDLDLLSPAELSDLSYRPKEASPDDTLRMFRVRVKAANGPRTWTLTLSAVSIEDAGRLARSDLGADWVILEVQPA